MWTRTRGFRGTGVQLCPHHTQERASSGRYVSARGLRPSGWAAWGTSRGLASYQAALSWFAGGQLKEILQLEQSGPSLQPL